MTRAVRRRIVPVLLVIVILVLGTLAAGCSAGAPSPVPPSPNEAREFLERANQSSLKLGIAQSRAGWIQQTYINDDTEALAAKANLEYLDNAAKLAKEATRFDHVDVSPEGRRQLDLLKVALVLAPPSDPREAEELAGIAARLESTYGK